MADTIDFPGKKLSSLERGRRIKDGIAKSQNCGTGKGTGATEAIRKRQEAAALKRQRLENYERLKTLLEDKFEVNISDDEAMVLLIHYLTMALE